MSYRNKRNKREYQKQKRRERKAIKRKQRIKERRSGIFQLFDWEPTQETGPNGEFVAGCLK